ncbi:MAG: DUF5683 domain-containing protein [Prevotellaceae bacterium]|jgi:hypothetical protein|nr:DUF5683 domain-containing protein [Prevotellaceae bacterium]
MNQTQNQNTQQTDSLANQEPAEPPFKFKSYFTSFVWVDDSLGTGKVRKDTLPIGRMWIASIVVPGYSQAYNRQFWKIPIAYGVIGTSLYFGYQNNLKFQETSEDRYAQNRDLLYVGAFLAYWGTMLDGVINYKSPLEILPGRASLYSTLIPGLGQAYNGDYWKIPIFCGGLMVCGYFIQFNNMQYQRYRKAYNNPDSYGGRLSSENLKWYRDTYRRYRDYSILAGVAVYALTIIDANTFAYFSDFDVSDDLSLRIRPGIIEPLDARYAMHTRPLSVGLKMNINF